MELTGQLNQIIPVLIAVLFSLLYILLYYSVSEIYTRSIFDVLLLCKRIPCLSDITIAQNVESLRKFNANQLKEPPKYYLTYLFLFIMLINIINENTTYVKADLLLNELPKSVVCLPIVQESTMKLLGVISVTNLYNLLRPKNESLYSFIYKKIVNCLPIHWRVYIENHYQLLTETMSNNSDLDPDKRLPYPSPIIDFELVEDDILSVDLSPYTVLPNATLAQVYFMFTLDICPTAYVTDNGILIGVIERELLLKFIRDQNKF